jgi:L-idonate 5-dehydrogenase
MRAAFFEAHRTITVRDAPVPDPSPGEVRLKVRYCGICGSDLSLYKTGALAGPDVILGHEIAAEVDLDPAGRWAPGTRVVPFPARGCGECLWCREGRPRYCQNRSYQDYGGLAEFVCYPSSGLIHVPDGLDNRMAAVTEPLGVALRAVDIADPEPGDLAYVSGLGSIGLFSVSGLADRGCRVVGADPRPDRRDLARRLGCEEVLDPIRDDPTEATLALDPHGPRAAFECAGVPESLQQTFDVCGHLGTVAILGIPLSPVLLLQMPLKEQRAFSISGPSPASMAGAMDLLQRRPQTADVITDTVPLDGADAAFASLADGTSGVKVLVEPWK